VVGERHRHFTQAHPYSLQNSEALAAFNYEVVEQRTVADSNRQETCVTTPNKVSLQDLSSYVTVRLGRSLFFRTECSEHVQKQYF